MKTRDVLFGALSLSALLSSIAAGTGCRGGVDTDPADAGAGGSVILDGGGEIPQPPDGPSKCPAGACNYQTNAECTPQQSCVPLPDDSGNAPPACLPAGQVAAGADCAMYTDCLPGHLCSGGKCRELCCGGDWTGCSNAAERCIQKHSVSDGKGGVIVTGAMLCMPVDGCDALDPAASCISKPGTTCQIVDPTGATSCLPEGTGDSGQPCPCKGGFLCVSGACRRLCKAVEGGGEPSCQEGEGICVHYHRDPPGVGECTPTDN